MSSRRESRRDRNHVEGEGWSEGAEKGRCRGKAIPYGVYDVGGNSAWVSVGMDHDTPVFAINSIATWWRKDE
jgi:hypothetical protein